MSAIQQSKALLRKQIKENIGKIPMADRERQSDFVYRQLINLPAFKNSQRISVYLSTADEISTDAFVRKSFELNKQIFVPRYRGNVMQMVKLESLQDWETLPLTKWLIRQPSVHDVRDDAMETGGLDLVVAPGVGFTKDGWRMGHGKGYYDSFLTKLIASQPKRPNIVAVCFKEQLVENLPRHDHDVHIDQVIYSEH